ncbi:hypothetical protein HPB50_004290 [Hyalomma asiaticum]|uniref:Uncharacterized protein n=1 Tax=Hyalomma asiaticum TaxID=266040 RepID=A0ACB7S3U6_HYAAI|nr:hypothetical protein HPB50_004290 [Hyalomma asiaticum]
MPTEADYELWRYLMVPFDYSTSQIKNIAGLNQRIPKYNTTVYPGALRLFNSSTMRIFRESRDS